MPTKGVNAIRKRNIETQKEPQRILDGIKCRLKCKSWTNSAVVWKPKRFVLLSGLVVIVAFVFWPTELDPKPYHFKVPPSFEGVLSKNDLLSKASKHYSGLLTGPESLAFRDGYLYTGTADGRILRIKKGKIELLARFVDKCDGNEMKCGRPLGVRFECCGRLLVVDSYLGLFRIDVNNGSYEMLISSNQTINGHKSKFLNDVAVSSAGMIYVTDTSVKWSRAQFRMLGLELNPDGRVIEYNPRTGQAVAVCTSVNGNGIEMSANEDHVIICDTAAARLLKCYIKGDKRGQVALFMDNLPGHPDNIRRSASGGYWVALTAVRLPNTTRPFFEILSPYPSIRCLLYKSKILVDYITQIIFKNPEETPRRKKTYGLVIEVDGNGDYRRSFHDPTGTFVGISHIEEHDDKLFLGSATNDFIGILDLNK